MDLIAGVFASFDTISRTTCSCLYYVKKNPRVLKKLMEEISKYKLDCIEEIAAPKLRDAFQNCEYLNYVVKEGLRFDVPSPITLTYKAYEEVDICGVKIPKGQELIMGIHYVHFNPEEWHRPTEFLPERFDPESELFLKPGTNSKRHPKSFNAFSFGKRRCVGQTLAVQSIKVILARLLTNLNFEITQDLMDREKPSFDLYSNTELTFKVV